MPAWWLTDYEPEYKLTDICLNLDWLIQGVLDGGILSDSPISAEQADQMLAWISATVDLAIEGLLNTLQAYQDQKAALNKNDTFGAAMLQMLIDYYKAQLELAQAVKGELLMSFTYHHIIETGDEANPYGYTEATPEERLEMVKKLQKVQVMAGCVPAKAPKKSLTYRIAGILTVGLHILGSRMSSNEAAASGPERRKIPIIPFVVGIGVFVLIGLGTIWLGLPDQNNVTVDDDTGSHVVLPSITLTPEPQDKTNSSNVQIVLTEEVTDEPTEELCKETGKYCTCEGVAYSIVMCADGSRTDTPVGKCTPDPAQCGSAGNTSDPCANNGGLQYTGQACTCQGQVDLVVICNDGTKTDTITTQPCTPNAAQCSGSDQGGSGSCPCACATVCPGISCIMVCKDCKGNSCTP